MTEIQNCLPERARHFFIRLRNSKWEESTKYYTAKLSKSRSEAAARNMLNSGFQQSVEWNITMDRMGDWAYQYFEAAIEACKLYEIALTRELCSCIEIAVTDLLLSQQRNALNNSATGAAGAITIPLSVRQQLSERPQSLPRYNEIMIALERARVASEKAAAQKLIAPETLAMAVIPKESREGNRPDVLHVLIASPGDVKEERDAATRAIYEWNAINANRGMINILLNPIRWETHSYPESGDRPQALLNRQIVADGDFLIGIFGAKVGTPTGVAESGTIEEIEQFRLAGKYVALYFSNAPVARNADRNQLDALDRYQQARKKDTKYEVFSSADDLHGQLFKHLTGIVRRVAEPLRLGMWRQEAGVQEPLGNVAKDMPKQEETARRQVDWKGLEEQKWEPLVSLVLKVEGQEQVNTLSLKSPVEFALVEAALLSSSGIKLHQFPVEGDRVFSRGFSVPIDHKSLLKIANNDQGYLRFGLFFEGVLSYRVVRQSDGINSAVGFPFGPKL